MRTKWREAKQATQLVNQERNRNRPVLNQVVEPTHQLKWLICDFCHDFWGSKRQNNKSKIQCDENNADEQPAQTFPINPAPLESREPTKTPITMADYLPTSSIPSLHTSPSRKRVHESSRSSAKYRTASCATMASVGPSSLEVMEPMPSAPIANVPQSRSSIHRSPSPKAATAKQRSNGAPNIDQAPEPKLTNGSTVDSTVNGGVNQRQYIVSVAYFVA